MLKSLVWNFTPHFSVVVVAQLERLCVERHIRPAKDMLVLNKSSLGLNWHVEVIPVGVRVMGLVTNKELCQVIWGIIIKNFLHKYSFIVSELLR